MTCKDNCLHYKVCKSISWQLPFLNPKECDCFEDKSKYIELPCKVGDMVYAHCNTVNQIVGYSVEDIHIDDEKTSFFATAFDVYFNEFLDEKEFNLEDIGKTVFITKEEAETKLKELQDVR